MLSLCTLYRKTSTSFLPRFSMNTNFFHSQCPQLFTLLDFIHNIGFPIVYSKDISISSKKIKEGIMNSLTKKTCSKENKELQTNVHVSRPPCAQHIKMERKHYHCNILSCSFFGEKKRKSTFPLQTKHTLYLDYFPRTCPSFFPSNV